MSLDQIISDLKQAVRAQISVKKNYKNVPLQVKLNAKSLDLIVESKSTVQKVDKGQTICPFQSNFQTKRKVLLVDCPCDIQDPLLERMTFEQFLDLKNKGSLGKILKKSVVVTVPIKVGSMLKAYGKVFQRFKNVPLVCATKVNKANLLQYKTKEFLAVSSCFGCKVGPLTMENSQLIEKIKRILNVLKINNRKILKVTLKTTQGIPFILSNKDLHEFEQ